MQNNNNTENDDENISEQEKEVIGNYNEQQLNDNEFNSTIINGSDNIISTDPRLSYSLSTNESELSSNSNINSDSLEIVISNGSFNQDDIINFWNEINNNALDFDSYDDSSEFQIFNEILGKKKKVKSSSIPTVQGTLYQQVNNILVLNDIISPNEICYSRNNDTNSLEKNSGSMYRSSPPIYRSSPPIYRSIHGAQKFNVIKFKKFHT